MKTVDAYLANIARPDLKEMAAALRGLILDTAPHFEEGVKWGVPCYSIKGKNACYFVSLKDSINLGFYYGTSLTDPQKLMKGTGKNLLHIKLKTLKDLDKSGIPELIKEAAGLAAGA